MRKQKGCPLLLLFLTSQLLMLSTSLTLRLIMTTMEVRQILAREMTPDPCLSIPKPRALAGGKESDPGLSKNVAVWQILQMHLKRKLQKLQSLLSHENGIVDKFNVVQKKILIHI